MEINSYYNNIGTNLTRKRRGGDATTTESLSADLTRTKCERWKNFGNGRRGL